MTPNLGNLQGPASYVEYELGCLKDTLKSLSEVRKDQDTIPVYKTSGDTLAGTFIQKVNEQGKEAIGPKEVNEKAPSFLSNIVKQAKEFMSTATDVASVVLGLPKEREIADPTAALHDINELFDQTLRDLSEREGRLNAVQLERCRAQLMEISEVLSGAQKGMENMKPSDSAEFQKESARFKGFCNDVKSALKTEEGTAAETRSRSITPPKAKDLTASAALAILGRIKSSEPNKNVTKEDLEERNFQAKRYFSALNDAIHKISSNEALNDSTFELPNIKEGSTKMITIDQKRLDTINEVLAKREITPPAGRELKVGDQIGVKMQDGLLVIEYTPNRPNE